MTEVLTAAQMRAIEQAAIGAGAVTGLELMERAGQGVVQAIFAHWPALATGAHNAVVLCGPGNNGGDGFVVARLLRDLGWTIEVFLFGDPEKLPPDARTNYHRWVDRGAVRPLSRSAFKASTVQSESSGYAALYIDALFGIGLSRPLEGELAGVRDLLAGVYGDDYESRIVSIDVPSGLCSDSGKVLSTTVDDWARLHSALTVTFDSPKVGHFIHDGPHICGKLVVADIGLKQWRTSHHVSSPNGKSVRAPRRAMVILNGFDDLVEDSRNQTSPIAFLDKSVKGTGSYHAHKFTHGHALILTGGAGRTGAARLAARGALRIGAGLVTLGVPGSAQQEVACQITALMMRRVDGPDGLSSLLEDARMNALCMGPGMGLDRAKQLVPVALGSKRPAVLDADALTAFADAPETLFDQLHENCVLTPHAGEFARLFPEIAAQLNAAPTRGPAYSKVDATRAAAAQAGCVVLFKGADTVIASPDGQCRINAALYHRSAPWLATAGAGDVLAGFIAGLLARGLPALQAAEAAAYLHVEAARAFGPGLIAEDLPEALPQVMRRLLP